MNEGAARRWQGRAETALVVFLYALPLTLSWTVAGAHIAAGVASALALGLGLGARRWLVVRTPADVAFIAFAVASGLAAAFALPATSDPTPLKKLLLIPLVHMVAGALAPPARLRMGLRLYVGALAATALVAAAVFLLRHREPGARLSTTTHYMTLSGLLVLAWPMAATAFWNANGRRRAFYALATVALTFALVLTSTRGAYLALPVAVAAILMRTRPRWLFLVPVLAFFAYLLLPPVYRDRIRTSFDPTFHSNADRLQMWQAGLAMWRHRPVTGVGLGDLQPIYRTYAPQGVARIYGHLHNNWIHLLATTGALGVLAFGYLMLQCGRIVHRAGRTPADMELRALALGGWGSFWGFQVMGLFEWNFGDVEVTMSFYFLLGLFAALGQLGAAPRNASSVAPIPDDLAAG